jgi:hypothetical protein
MLNQRRLISPGCCKPQSHCSASTSGRVGASHFWEYLDRRGIETQCLCGFGREWTPEPLDKLYIDGTTGRLVVPEPATLRNKVVENSLCRFSQFGTF